jgi:DNA repair protein RecO (recombination protein O)
MKQQTTQAIILKRINFSEADRILTVITSDYGKMSVLAKGARRSKSKLAGGLELFSVSDISFIDGKSELKTLVSTRLQKHYGNIVGDMKSTMLAYSFLKMIDESTKEECEDEFFALLQNALEALQENQEYPEVVQLWFVDTLLGKTGVAINTSQQVNGDQFTEDALYEFDYDAMGFYEHKTGKYTPKHIKFLRLLAKVSAPSHLIKIAESQRLTKDLQKLLEYCYKLQH